MFAILQAREQLMSRQFTLTNELRSLAMMSSLLSLITVSYWTFSAHFLGRDAPVDRCISKVIHGLLAMRARLEAICQDPLVYERMLFVDCKWPAFDAVCMHYAMDHMAVALCKSHGSREAISRSGAVALNLAPSIYHQSEP